ncbi:MAG: dienelactone hydrolase family protein [Burkholderiales bacterium]
MTYETVAFPDATGNQIPGWLFKPKSGRGIGVCMIHDIRGFRDDYVNVATPFVEHGFIVLLPNIFYAVEPIDIIDPEGIPRKSYRGKLPESRQVEIMIATINKLKSMPETGGKVAVTGYCLGGTLSYLAACRDDVGAAAGYYATSAHAHLDKARDIKRPLYMHISETDRTHTPEDAQRLRDTLDTVPLAKWHIYPGTVHGFANNDHPRYHAAATTLANSRTFELFDAIK